MAKLGKILGPIVVILALAVAVLSFLLFQQRMKFRERSAIMAQALAEIAAKVDQDAASGTASDVTFTRATDGGKEGGSLGWEACKKLKFDGKENAFSSTVQKVVTLIQNVQAQRGEMRDKVIEIASSIGAPAPNAEDMASLENYGSSLDAFASYAKNFRARYDKYVAELNDLGRKTEGKGIPQFSAKSADGTFSANDASAFKEIGDRVTGLVASSKALTEIVGAAKAKLSAFNGWTYDVRRLAPDSIDLTKGADQLKMVGDTFLKDLEEVNSQLIAYASLQTKYAELEDSKRDLDERYDKLLQEKKDLNAMVEKIIGVGDKMNVEPISSIAEVDADVIGTVMSIEPEFKFVVLDLDYSKVVNGVRLSICAGDKYICSVRVVSVNQYNAVAAWIDGEGDFAAVKVGNNALVSAQSLQPQE